MIAALALALVLESEPPSFHRDVAPLVHAKCAVCHHAGEPAAPFELVSYEDVLRRSRQMLLAAETGLMPPWLPEPGDVSFAGDRSLAPGELALLRAWIEAGAPAGDPAQAPTPPTFAAAGAWRLGPPDLVAEASEPFELRADGPDVFVNLVLPTGAPRWRFVRAVELSFASAAVHHAILQVDATGGARRRAEREPGPGFQGMDMSPSEPPDGHFVAWTPGHVPRECAPDMAWRLPPRSDLVLQLHLTPTGKPECIAPRVGLHFTDRPPSRFPYSIVLDRDDIDIPAGRARYTLRDEYVLPTSVQAFGVYPHAHYRGKSVRLTALAPSGELLTLLRIDAWDFDWQDEYRFAAPLDLPVGTRLAMEWTWDNSSDNARNPALPPERVRFGLESKDEMGTVTLHVLPLEPDGQIRLREARWRHALAKHPGDPAASARLGGVLTDAGLALEPGTERAHALDEARRLLARALEALPKDADALVSFGRILAEREPTKALEAFEAALRADPSCEPAHVEQARTLELMGRGRDALAHLRTTLERDPGLHLVRAELALWLARAGQIDEPLGHLERVARERPGTPEVHNNLANLLFASGRFERAAAEYARALEARPDYAFAHLNLGRVLLELGRAEEARGHLERALELDPESEPARVALEAAREALRVR